MLGVEFWERRKSAANDEWAYWMRVLHSGVSGRHRELAVARERMAEARATVCALELEFAREREAGAEVAE